MTQENPTYKMAIVGPRESTQGFEAVGVTSVNASTSSEATEKLFELKKATQKINGENKPLYAVIFVLEELLANISRDDYLRLTAHALPSIIALPGAQGATGFGVKRLGKLVERAVGQNILND